MAGGVALNCVANARLARGPVRARLGPARGGRCRDGAGVERSRGPPSGRHLRAYGDRGARARFGAMTRSRTRSAMLPCRTTGRPSSPTSWPTSWPATASSAGSRAKRVRPAGARSSQPAGGPLAGRQPAAHERHQGPRGVPACGADRPLRAASEIFEGVVPSPYMLFVHRVRPEWRERIAAAVHIDGTAGTDRRPRDEPLLAQLLGRSSGAPASLS